MGTVLAHQQPARQALPGQVETKARGRCGLLGHQHVKIAVQAALLAASSRRKASVPIRQAAPEPSTSATSEINPSVGK
jgi:hypothetical protein